MTTRERRFVTFGEFISGFFGVVAALAWMWAMGVLVALACLGVLHLLWRIGVMDEGPRPGDLVAYPDEDR